MKIFVDGGRDYIKRCADLDVEAIDLISIAHITPEKNECFELIKPIIKKKFLNDAYPFNCASKPLH